MATANKSNSSSTAATKLAVDGAKSKTTRKATLKDTDELTLTASIPNVTYKDKKTGDYYSWEYAGDSEVITFATLKDMNRNHKYLKNLLLILDDDRAIKHFRLERLYKNYNELLSTGSYTRDNVNSLGEKLASLPANVTRTLVTKIKSNVANGDITDVTVIKKLEQILHIDLFELL